MALVTGSATASVDINGTASFSGSGMALALAQADFATKTIPAVPALNSIVAPYNASRPSNANDRALVIAAILSIAQESARLANAYASVLVTYIQTNAFAVVTTQSLGVTPNPNNAATAIVHPASTVYIPIA